MAGRTVVHVVAALNERAIADVVRTVADEMARTGFDMVIIACHLSPDAPWPRHARVIGLGGSGKRTFQTVPQLFRELRRIDPEVVFAHGEGPARASLLATRMMPAPPPVVTITHNHYSSYAWDFPWLRRVIDGHLLRSAAAVTGVSPGVADDLRSAFPAVAARVHTLPAPLTRARQLTDLSVEPTVHPWLENPGVPARPLLVSVAHLSARKDQLTLVRVMAELRRRRPRHAPRLLIIGAADGLYAQRVAALIDELGLSGQIDLLGAVANPFPYIARASALVSTSRNEGMGIAIVEALALGTPVIATDAPSGPRWVLRDGRHGLLAPVGDVPALADAVESVVDDAAVRARLIASGRQRARDFSPRGIAAQYEALAATLTRAPVATVSGPQISERERPVPKQRVS